MIKKQL